MPSRRGAAAVEQAEDLLCGLGDVGAGAVNGADARGLEEIVVLGRDDAAADHQNIVRSAGFQRRHQIGRDAAPEVRGYLASAGRDFPVLTLTASKALVSAAHANEAVRGAKLAISEALAVTGARKLHLFLSTPAPFALLLGHRLNATAEIQCYERIEVGVYQPTCCMNLA